MRLSSIQDIERLYARQGGLSYDEGVTQLEHALQCGSLAQAEGAAPSLVVAALLHDIGHLFEDEGDAVRFDHRHQVAGAAALVGLFDEAVLQPIALHVAAKRYLCFKEARYHRALSSASQRSLELQGGPFDALEAAAFEQMAFWEDAVTLRRFDDMGKREEYSMRQFAEFAPLMCSLLTGNAVA